MSRPETYPHQYNTLLDIIDTGANAYANYAQKRRLDNVNRAEVFEKAATALGDLYFLKDTPGGMKQFRVDWGEQTDHLVSILNRSIAQEKASEIQINKTPNGSSRWKENLPPPIKNSLETIESITRTFHLNWIFYRNPSRQEHLASLQGFEKQDKARFFDKLKVSGKVFAFSSAYYGLFEYVGMGAAYVIPLLEKAPGVDPKHAIALSFLVKYGAALLLAKQNLKLLYNPNVNNATYPPTTAAFFLSDKKVQAGSTILASLLIPGGIIDGLSLSGLAFSKGDDIIFARNLILGALTVPEIYYAKQWMQKNSEEPPSINLRAISPSIEKFTQKLRGRFNTHGN